MTNKQQQCLLTYLGYDPGGIDGIDGPRTQAALDSFRADYGVGAEGLVGAVAGTVAKLEKPDSSMEPSQESKPETGTFWDSIRHFNREEFRCPCGKCGGFPVEPQKELVLTMDDMCEAFGSAVIVVPPDGHSGGSGVRCAAYNAALSGSVSNSRHLLGKAADFTAPGVPAAKIEAYLAKIKNNGTIRYWYKITAGSYHMDVQ